jgi:hypothetical protein
MPPAPAQSPDLASALDAFPDEAALVRRLFLADRAFRGACEDYRLAREGLESFERLRRDGPRPEVDDYRRLVLELEAEMRDMIRSARART